jgi:hypothetical protein
MKIKSTFGILVSMNTLEHHSKSVKSYQIKKIKYLKILKNTQYWVGFYIRLKGRIKDYSSFSKKWQS